MKCEEAAEFVSALCDGQQIPREVAGHIGVCETCRTRLHEYMELGAELRRVASLEFDEVTKANSWERENSPSWWEKARASMRIPRFAFALLILTIAGLGSALAIVKAQSKAQSEVLSFTLEVPRAERPIHGAIYVNRGPDDQGMRFMIAVADPSGMLKGKLRILENNGSRLKLGAHFQFYPAALQGLQMTLRYDESFSGTEKLYEFTPGQPLKIEIEGVGKAEFTGTLQAYMPVLSSTTSQTLVPPADELRILSPVLLQGDHVVFNFGGFSSVSSGKEWAVQAYIPSAGRFVIAQMPFEGAVKGHVATNTYSRVRFELRGKNYELVSGAPITRSEVLWVRNDPNFKPSDELMRASDNGPFMGSLRLDSGLAKVQ